MNPHLLAYAGPDQVMTVTSGLASILGVLLIFWHKVMAFFGKIVTTFVARSGRRPSRNKDTSPRFPRSTFDKKDRDWPGRP